MDGEQRHARRYLFLQGMATPFFARLGKGLARRGHTVKRINFTAGDRLYWRLPGSIAYRGTHDDWPRFLEQHLTDWRITDIVLFGDWRPLHAAAIRIAMLRGLPVHVFEEGYMRPFWITLEQGGVNKNSSLSRDPAWYLNEAKQLPAWRDGVPVFGTFANRAVNDVVYNVVNGLMAWRYPRYRTHLPVNPFVDYAGWIRRYVRAPLIRRRTRAAMQALSASGKPYYLAPLQLDGDSQLRVNSRYGSLGPAIEEIVRSFSTHAPDDTLLVLKEHPLDNQLVDWRAQAMSLAEQLGVGDRVFYLVTPDIVTLMQRSRGLVTVNSTSGLLAISFGLPVKTLARAIYDLPGLTFQGALDRFWREGGAPDAALADAFRRVVVQRTQINGDFFSRRGLDMAVAGAVTRLEAAALEHALTRIAPMKQPVTQLPEGALALSGGAD